jgi:enterochelin esterase-like enzyme
MDMFFIFFFQQSNIKIVRILATICLGLVLGTGLHACNTIPQPTEVIIPRTAPTSLTYPTRTIILLTPSQTSSPGVTPSPSLVAYPEITTTAQHSQTPAPLDCWASGGNVEIGQLETEILVQPLEYTVYLPPCYSEQPERAYPVLYMIHGQNYTDDQWLRLGAGDVVDRLSAAGELPPFIIVMPRDRVWQEPTEDHFGQAVVDRLIPWIDANYRTIPGREYRAVGGLSRGGAWALHLGLTHPELFGAIGMHSGFAFHSDIPFIRQRLEAMPTELMPRFYQDLGDNDRPEIAASAIWFEALLTHYNIPHEWHLFSGYHEEAYWQSHVEQYLRWYAQNWPMNP